MKQIGGTYQQFFATYPIFKEWLALSRNSPYYDQCLLIVTRLYNLWSVDKTVWLLTPEDSQHLRISERNSRE